MTWLSQWLHLIIWPSRPPPQSPQHQFQRCWRIAPMIPMLPDLLQALARQILQNRKHFSRGSWQSWLSDFRPLQGQMLYKAPKICTNGATIEASFAAIHNNCLRHLSACHAVTAYKTAVSALLLQAMLMHFSQASKDLSTARWLACCLKVFFQVLTQPQSGYMHELP